MRRLPCAYAVVINVSIVEVVEELKMIGDTGPALLIFDRELGKREA